VSTRAAKQFFRWAISITAIVAALVHAFVPSIVIDAVTALLLGVAAIPWLGLLFKSVELPGGLKVEYHELQEATEKARTSGLLEPVPISEPKPLYIEIATQDANLALAGLRIELEKELVSLAARYDIQRERKSLGRLAQELTNKHVFGAGAYLAFMDLIHLLNNAVHGAEVDPAAVDWALTSGQEILASLRAK
jgi:hypothetical protein